MGSGKIAVSGSSSGIKGREKSADHFSKAQIQALYSTHRVTRNAQQREKFLTPDFKEVIIDPFLFRLQNPKEFPGFADPRNCMVLWARPPEHILKLAAQLQMMLKDIAPSKWTEDLAVFVESLRRSKKDLPRIASPRCVKDHVSYGLKVDEVASAIHPRRGETGD